ncbi:TolC family protein [Paracoccus sp. (in: a-proteobacteria)]|uniref:TolC family protein n=1 Tax=Paracoccus sp. TaxID=267 RepID=UPI0026E007F0|nr:TolC family protein [Paracoccus sp. (in: a-proteobacteria)]MDO5647249.1 hypothetical protein [Paracoccus sp. (in: a-proteobacteria)]
MKHASLVVVLALSACAAVPELTGPVTAIPAAEFQRADAPVWRMDFGDAGLRTMLAQADAQGLDVAAARARFRAADLTLASVGRGVTTTADARMDRAGGRLDGAISWEPDLAGRFDAALQSAGLERAASGMDLLIARRTVAREVAQGWVSLIESRIAAARINTDIATETRALTLIRARHAAGESTGADLAAREQALIRLRADAAGASGRVALAESRLRALGVQTIPSGASLKSARRPAPPARTDLGATGAAPGVCAAWLRFRAADASRAETLAAARPRVVVTSSIEAAAKTLAGLVAGNAAAVTHSVRVEGALIDAGQTRQRVDQARLSVAQAEIDWLRARSQAEIAALEAVVAQHTAEGALSAALSAWQSAQAEQTRTRARLDAGLADGVEMAESDRAVAAAQRDIDAARADAFRAAAALHDALPPPVAGCGPAL